MEKDWLITIKMPLIDTSWLTNATDVDMETCWQTHSVLEITPISRATFDWIPCEIHFTQANSCWHEKQMKQNSVIYYKA